MTDKAAEFDRKKHGLKALARFIRAGVVGERGEALSDEQVAKLDDDDVQALRDAGVVQVTDGRGKVPGEPSEPPVAEVDPAK